MMGDAEVTLGKVMDRVRSKNPRNACRIDSAVKVPQQTWRPRGSTVGQA
jgi:hypothetical protein